MEAVPAYDGFNGHKSIDYIFNIQLRIKQVWKSRLSVAQIYIFVYSIKAGDSSDWKKIMIYLKWFKQCC